MLQSKNLCNCSMIHTHHYSTLSMGKIFPSCQGDRTQWAHYSEEHQMKTGWDS